VSQGGLICERCQKEEYKRTQIRSGTVAILRRLGEPDGASIRNLVVSREQWNEIRPLVVSAISHVMGRRPKMLKYLNF
jgi:DNA repair protein RecO (recombination protein O)